ncbi:hypothetical protein LIER_30959 [Lithospermum erythrorhizon]|uniref:Uncharacterized protein n=1 Tax=Lithospermum erythrorhizon TaxID=34254 RepID=A0AAV3RT42_LITER
MGEIIRKMSKGKPKVSDNINRITNKRIAKDVEDVPTEEVDFCCKEHEARWKFLCARNILPEKFLFDLTYNNQKNIDILQDAGVLEILSEIGPQWPQLVREFVCNLSEEASNTASSMFYKVKLRGHVFNFNPALINMHYGMNNEGIT